MEKLEKLSKKEKIRELEVRVKTLTERSTNYQTESKRNYEMSLSKDKIIKSFKKLFYKLYWRKDVY